MHRLKFACLRLQMSRSSHTSGTKLGPPQAAPQIMSLFPLPPSYPQKNEPAQVERDCKAWGKRLQGLASRGLLQLVSKHVTMFEPHFLTGMWYVFLVFWDIIQKQNIWVLAVVKIVCPWNVWTPKTHWCWLPPKSTAQGTWTKKPLLHSRVNPRFLDTMQNTESMIKQDNLILEFNIYIYI